MNKTVCFIVLFLLTIPSVSWPDPADQFTAVVASSLTSKTKPVLGTDGNFHAVYELMLTNTQKLPATLTSIEVLDSSGLSRAIETFEEDELLARLRTLDDSNDLSRAIETFEEDELLARLRTLDDSNDLSRAIETFEDELLAQLRTLDDSNDLSRVIETFEEDELLARLRTLDNQPPPNREIGFNGSRLFLIHVTFESRDDIPLELMHHITYRVNTSEIDPTPIITSYTGAPFTLSHRRLPVVGAPLEGKYWVAIDGCCQADLNGHRNTGLSVNGQLYYAQRFAIDWMRLDDQGRLVHGDQSQLDSYTSYGANVLAIANGTVVDTLDTLDEQIPGSDPDPGTVTLQNVTGNHIILKLNKGIYAFYAHLQKGANGVRVRPGDHVRRGQVIGKLGNSGNTKAPHLHLHLMDGPSVLGSNGIPYVIRRFDSAGQIPADQIPPVDETDWRQALFPTPLPRHRQFPLDLDIVNFER